MTIKMTPKFLNSKIVPDHPNNRIQVIMDALKWPWQWRKRRHIDQHFKSLIFMAEGCAAVDRLFARMHHIIDEMDPLHRGAEYHMDIALQAFRHVQVTGVKGGEKFLEAFKEECRVRLRRREASEFDKGKNE